MAEGEVTAGNGSVKLSLKDRSLGIGGKDAVLMLLIVLLGVLAYLRTVTLDKTIQEQSGHIQRLYQGQDSLKAELFRQNELVSAQTEVLRQEMYQQNALLNANNTTLRQMLDTHDYNMGREPTDRLPLSLERKPH